MEFIIEFLIKDDALTKWFIILAIFGAVTNIYCYLLMKDSTDRQIVLKKRKDKEI